MKDKKKVMLTLLISLLLVSIFVSACGSQETAVSDAEQQVESETVAEEETVADNEETEAQVTEEDEVVTIRFQDWRLAEEPAATALKNIITEFEAAHPNIKVQLEPVSNSERIDKFNNQFMAGDPPDVVRFNLTELPSEIAMGAFMPLDSYIENEGGDAFLEDFVDFQIDVATKDGSVYAIPHEGDAFVFYVNTDLWEAVGLDPVNDPPKTFEELREANLALTNSAENIYAFSMWPYWGWMQSWFTAMGTDYFNKDYTETYLDTPEAIEAFTYFTGMYTDDKVIPPGVTEVGYGDQVALMAQEQVAYIQGPYATWGGIIAGNPDIEDHLAVMAFPGTGETAGRGTHFAIGTGSKHPDQAWELINWLTSADMMYQFFEEGSMLPTRKSALESIDLEEYPSAKVLVEEAIPNAKTTYPAFEEWNRCSTILADAITATLLEQVEPEDAMTQAAQGIREILAERQ